MEQTPNDPARPLGQEEQKVAILDDAQPVMINTVVNSDNAPLRSVKQERSLEVQKFECFFCEEEIKEPNNARCSVCDENIAAQDFAMQLNGKRQAGRCSCCEHSTHSACMQENQRNTYDFGDVYLCLRTH